MALLRRPCGVMLGSAMPHSRRRQLRDSNSCAFQCRLSPDSVAGGQRTDLRQPANLVFTAHAQVRLESVAAEPPAGSGVEADPREGGARAPGAGPAALRPGDCHTALLRLSRDAPAPAGPLGDVVVTWRRAGCVLWEGCTAGYHVVMHSRAVAAARPLSDVPTAWP